MVSGLHGVTHREAGVSISDLQSACVFSVTLVMPIAAAIIHSKKPLLAL
ncbi:MAG TPA: hypothetical protein VH500_01635 [Nitrososphaeraceae archaeon]